MDEWNNIKTVPIAGYYWLRGVWPDGSVYESLSETIYGNTIIKPDEVTATHWREMAAFESNWMELTEDDWEEWEKEINGGK